MAFLFGVFCKVVRKYSVRVSFGCDLAPSLLEERRREGFKGRRDRPFRVGFPGR